MSDADVALAEGFPITLADGTQVNLYYSMRSIRALERRFGDVETIAKNFEAIGTDGSGPIFTDLTDLMAPGLLHVRITDPDTGRRMRLGEDPDVCAEHLAGAHMREYVAACLLAIQQAFPTPEQQEAGEDPTLQAEGSPGPSGTTPRPSSSGEPTGPSGA